MNIDTLSERKADASTSEPVVKEEVVKEEIPTVPQVETPKTEPAPKPVQEIPGEEKERFNIRQQLKDAKAALNGTVNDDEKSLLVKEMTKLRKDLSQHDEQKPFNSSRQTTPSEQPIEDEQTIRENLKKLGYLSKQEVETTVDDIVRQRLYSVDAKRHQAEHSQAVNDFYNSRPDIAQDNELKQGMEAWILQNFKVEPNTPATQLSQYLQMAANYFAPKADNRQAIREGQQKVDAMNISGTGGGDGQVSKVPEHERQFLKTKGWSDDKIEKFYQ